MQKNPSLPLLNYDEIEWSISPLGISDRKPPKQLLKWIGNKQRFATRIALVFPESYNRYIEPFVGSGAVLGAMGPKKAIAGDTLKPLVEMWELLQRDPQKLYEHYEKSYKEFKKDRKGTYKRILDSYNSSPNPLDLVFITRSCYGGVVRFTKKGTMSTPIGPHEPISPESFYERMSLWRQRIQNTEFHHSSFEELLSQAGKGDVVYCDPPYVDSQSILYGAQSFSIQKMWDEIHKAKKRGALIAVSIDGKKRSGTKMIELNIPEGLFAREVFIDLGSSMLKRFQKKDKTMEGEGVHDRLLLTW